jgi:hypothetical protein
VLRNMGVALGYGLLAYASLMTGLKKLELNEEALPKIWMHLGRCWPNASNGHAARYRARGL